MVADGIVAALRSIVTLLVATLAVGPGLITPSKGRNVMHNDRRKQRTSEQVRRLVADPANQHGLLPP